MKKVWSFHKVDDIVGGINVKLSNMAGGFPFTLDGVEWADSERLYLCGEYSHNTEEHKEIQEKIRVKFLASGLTMLRSVS